MRYIIGLVLVLCNTQPKKNIIYFQRLPLFKMWLQFLIFFYLFTSCHNQELGEGEISFKLVITQVKKNVVAKNAFSIILHTSFPLIFVNNQLDAQFFFMYVYFYSLHVSGSYVPIIRRINCIKTTFGLCHSVHTKRSSTQSDIYQMSY